MSHPRLAALVLTLCTIAPAVRADPPVKRGKATSVLGASVRRDQPLPHPQVSAERPVVVGLVLIVLVGAAKIVLRRRISRRHAVSLDLMMVVIGFVLLLMVRLPMRGTSGVVGIGLFVGLAAVYRLLGNFEEPSDKE